MILDRLHPLVIQKTKDRDFLEANSTEIEQICKILVQAFHAGNRLYLCENGGSCADADHIAAEFIKDFRIKRKKAHKKAFSHSVLRQLQEGLPAVSLSGLANITAIANDMGYSLILCTAALYLCKGRRCAVSAVCLRTFFQHDKCSIYSP